MRLFVDEEQLNRLGIEQVCQRPVYRKFRAHWIKIQNQNDYDRAGVVIHTGAKIC